MGSPLARVVRLCVQTSTYTQDGRGEQTVYYGEKRWEGKTICTELYMIAGKVVSKSTKLLKLETLVL